MSVPAGSDYSPKTLRILAVRWRGAAALLRERSAQGLGLSKPWADLLGGILDDCADQVRVAIGELPPLGGVVPGPLVTSVDAALAARGETGREVFHEGAVQAVSAAFGGTLRRRELLVRLQEAHAWAEQEALELGLVRRPRRACEQCEAVDGRPHAESCPALLAQRHANSICEAIRELR